MNNNNITKGTTFLFLGLPELGGLLSLFFVLILTAYITTVLVDIVIVILVSSSKVLRSPMFYFIRNFLFSEIILVNVVVPNMLQVLWLDGATVDITGCFTQSYFIVASGSCECYLLAAMSYDRYLAICKPLHYSRIMDQRFQHLLALLCWALGFLLPLPILSFLVKLNFCDRNVIDHYFCDLPAMIMLSCSDTSALQIDIFVTACFVIVIPFVLVVISYVSIFVVILKIPSLLGRKKAFSTCSSHLLVVGMFYGSSIINYFIPVRGHPIVINKSIAIIVIVVTPFFNPIIYTLRNKEIRNVINGCNRWHWLKL